MCDLRLEQTRLVVCTHAHSDHYGQAAAVVARTGAELWMHPNHQHMTRMAEDPDAVLARRLEIARQSGVPDSRCVSMPPSAARASRASRA